LALALDVLPLASLIVIEQFNELVFVTLVDPVGSAKVA
jgi:hypothetical protein